MELLIKIPKEFEQHFQQDAFDDSLHRLSADAHLLAGLYEQETALMFSEALKTAIPIPPHGRLIDADAAAKQGWTINRTYSASPNEMVYEVKTMTDEVLPTIIPASEDSE